MSTQRPRIIPGNIPDLDTLEMVPTVLVPAKSLREGMILVDIDFVDEDGNSTPAAVLDHKMGRTVGASARWMFFDLDANRHRETDFHVNSMVRVAAA